MDYTCFEGMGALPFLIEERGGPMNNMQSASTYSSASNQLLESFQAQQQQQLNPNYYYNPPIHFNFPPVSWSTTDPTLLLSDQQPQRPEELFSGGSGCNSVNVSSESKRDDDMGIEGSCCGLSSFPTAVQELHHSRSSTNLCHHNGAGVNSSTAATGERMNLNVDTTMMDAGGASIRRSNGFSSGSSARSIDPFSFCGGGGGRGSGGGGNASSQSHWMPQMCSLTSDQYYGCGDGLMLPKLVSDPFSDSQQQHLQQQPLGTYYTSSTSVNCLHEADSCGSSDRDRSTTSEEINWMNNSSSVNNNSDIRTLPTLHRGCGDSVKGLMLSSPSVVPVEIVPDEYSSSIAAAANDDVELAAVTTAMLDHVRHHHHNHRSTCGSSTIECGAAAAPSGRVSWMSPGIGSCHNPLLQVQQMSNGLVPMLPRSLLGPFKTNQQRSQTFDSIHNVQSSVQRALPFSSSTSQPNDASSSGSIYPRYSSVDPVMPPLMNPGVVNNYTTSSNDSFCKDFHSFSNRLPQQQGAMAATASSVQTGGILGGKEFNLGGGFESRRDFGSEQPGTVLSASRKPNATSIEPQSVAARYRRKKISERVKILEKLIPGVDKMDTASMLDEAIEYVKFLQLQVQLLETMGEPEAANAPATTSTTTTTTTSTGNNNSSTLYNNTSNPCNVDSSALIGGGFGSSSHLSRSASFMQQVTIAAAANATTKPSSSPPLILSEVLQEQLFKQKLCLVSLRQFPQQQAR